ncbi:ABC transporter ATP-binding protein [Salinigranum sp. GCM10025319]|uniref:ABC transporter ATP-binding protein n=1 Tax=Salinigranum sp. GCM10025319 TaxID=3252687 RepID=UPI003620ED1E
MAKVRLENLRKVFDVPDGEEVAIERIDTTIQDEKLTCLLGPSGCGKTTLLRMIAGLEKPSEGRIYFDDEDVTNVRVQDRGVSMVFQNIALFPFKSVRDNISYGLKYEDVPKDTVKRKVEDIASQLGIAEFLDQMPNQLSGGQQQRVALGRSLIRDPEVFLLDEPMSALDERIRIKLRTELKELQRELATTTVYVTHNQEQAMALSDEIIILNDGQIEQQGTPDEIFDEPANVFVAEFIGSPRINLLEATLEGTALTVDGTDVSIAGPGASAHLAGDATREVFLGIRPSRIELSPESTGDSLRGTVSLLEKLGQEDVAFLDCPAIEQEVRVETDRTDIEEGTTYDLSFDPADVHLFDRASGEALRLDQAAKPAQ